MLGLLLLHGGTCRFGEPHNRSFPINDLLENFVKGPPLGISSSNLLKERFRYLSYKSFSKDRGIISERLLLDKSKDSKLTKSSNELGIEPCNLL